MAHDESRHSRVPPVLKREVLAGNPYFALNADQLEPTPGADPYTYYSMDCVHDAVVVVPVLPDGQVVVERIYRHPYQQWLLEFPAGGIGQGEDPAAAARRELAEETGYRAGTITMLGHCEPLTGLVRMRLHVALATDLELGAERELEAMELLEVVTMTGAEVDAAIEVAPASGFLTLPWLWYQRSLTQNDS